MTDNLPSLWEPSSFDYVKAGLCDFVVDGLPIYTLWNLAHLAKTPEEFFAGMQASSELGDIVRDHYDKGEPDDGTFDEEDPFEWWEPDEDDE